MLTRIMPLELLLGRSITKWKRLWMGWRREWALEWEERGIMEMEEVILLSFIENANRNKLSNDQFSNCAWKIKFIDWNRRDVVQSLACIDAIGRELPRISDQSHFLPQSLCSTSAIYITRWDNRKLWDLLGRLSDGCALVCTYLKR